MEIVNQIESLEGIEQLCIDECEKELFQNIEKQLPIRITSHYLKQIDWTNLDDPIRKICIPTIRELDTAGSLDTSGERSYTVCNGLQHKYRETALVLFTNECATYCRYCFRRRFVGTNKEEVMYDEGRVINYIVNHPEINNVLVSGGDPLTSETRRLIGFTKRLCNISSLNYIRIGTKMPIVYPKRVLDDTEFLEGLKKCSLKKQIIMVLQCNHVRELSEDTQKSISELQKAGVILRSQTVLLKGVNNKASTLVELFNKLTAIGVIPYYVFQCRPVKGICEEFQVSLIEGNRIINEAKASLNGMAKNFKYCMSMIEGKIEIIGILDNKMIFRYHEAPIDKNVGKVFLKEIEQNQCWLY